jgi:hypothetical protein
VRLESQLDKYDSRLSFYLPSLHPPFNRQIVADLAFLQERAANHQLLILPILLRCPAAATNYKESVPGICKSQAKLGVDS